jgi:hypothetical protein
VEGLSSLHAGGIAPRLLIIDDGWQVRGFPLKYTATKHAAQVQHQDNQYPSPLPLWAKHPEMGLLS